MKKAGSALARSGNPGNAYKNLVFRYVSQNFVVALTSISSVSFNSVLFNSALRGFVLFRFVLFCFPFCVVLFLLLLARRTGAHFSSSV